MFSPPVIVGLSLHGRGEAHALELPLELGPEGVPLLVNGLRLLVPRGVASQVEHAPLLLSLFQPENQLTQTYCNVRNYF